MAGVQLYKSTDVGAPVLSGQNGALIALLDACLVNGYGAKPAAGWTKAFTGTNLAAYRNSLANGTGHYLSVDDAGGASGNAARIARMRGFEAMTAITTGTGPFPTVAQISAGLHVLKSDTADATPSPWIILADEHTFYLFTKPGPTYGGSWSGFMFGDFFSLKAGDAFRSCTIGRAAEFNPGAWPFDEDRLQDTAVVNATNVGHYKPRTFAGVAQVATVFGKHCTDLAKKNFVPYPNPVDGSIAQAQLALHEDLGNLGAVVGRLRGVWDCLHPEMSDLNDGDTYNGSGAQAGKTFLVLKPLGGTLGAIKMLLLEISNTWETST